MELGGDGAGSRKESDIGPAFRATKQADCNRLSAGSSI